MGQTSNMKFLLILHCLEDAIEGCISLAFDMDVLGFLEISIFTWI
jgi:hypothetical protein